MQFNPDPNKQANEVFFLKNKFTNHTHQSNLTIITFLNAPINSLRTYFRVKTQFQCTYRSKNVKNATEL